MHVDYVIIPSSYNPVRLKSQLPASAYNEANFHFFALRYESLAYLQTQLSPFYKQRCFLLAHGTK